MYKRITILAYHAIEPEGSKSVRKEEMFYRTAPDNFKKQMHFLKKNGYTAVTMDELIRAEHDSELPDKPIMLTFDDGHISHYETVLPILKEAGFKGVFFPVVNEIGKKHRVNWTQVKELKDSGMEIGSRSMNNIILNRFSCQQLIVELKASKLELEENLGMEILAFSIPQGLHSQEISNVARAMGYKLVFTAFTGHISLFSNPYCLRRIGIRNSCTMQDFINIVHKKPIFITKKKIGQFAKDRIKKVIGVGSYNVLKRAVVENGRGKGVTGKGHCNE